MASLDPEYAGGRPRRITDDERREAVAVAGARPDSQGVALTRWSLPRLARHLTEAGVVEISGRAPGRVLAEAGLSFQRTRTWKASPDPDFEPKAARILGGRPRTRASTRSRRWPQRDPARRGLDVAAEHPRERAADGTRRARRARLHVVQGSRARRRRWPTGAPRRCSA
jgi:hypothetical protein